MIKYGDLVDYIKRNHISWNTNLFDVLEGFFEEYSQPQLPPSHSLPIQQEIFPGTMDALEELTSSFQPPADGEYTSEDLINLFSKT